MNKGSKLNIGFLGAGNVITKKVLPAMKDTNYCTPYSLARRNINDAKQTYIKNNFPTFHRSYVDLIKDSNIDIIYISTPPAFHLEHAKLCADYNKPVYLEKPAAKNYIESIEISDYFNSKNIPICIAHYRRSHPKFIKIKEILESGKLGKPIRVDSKINRIIQDDINQNWMFNPSLSGGGKFYDIAPHTIDIIQYLLGNLQKIDVNATIHKPTNTEATLEISYKLPNQVSGKLSFNALSDDKFDETIIRCQNGEIIFNVHNKISSFKIVQGPESFIVNLGSVPSLQAPMLDEFSLHIQGLRPNPCPLHKTVPTYKFIDECLKSIYPANSIKYV